MSQLTVASVTDASPSNININIILGPTEFPSRQEPASGPSPPERLKTHRLWLTTGISS